MNTISGFLMSLKGPVFLELQNCMNNLFGFPQNPKKIILFRVAKLYGIYFLDFHWLPIRPQKPDRRITMTAPQQCGQAATDTKKPDVRNTSGCLCGR